MSTILNIFTPLYSWCTSLGERLQTQDDFITYYQNYFEETSVCSRVFWVAAVVALVIACIYYFVCCNLSFSAAKRYIWLMVFLISFVITFFITPNVIVGHYDGFGGDQYNSGNTYLFRSIEGTLQEIISDINDNSQVEEANQIAEDCALRFIGTNKSASLGMFTMDEKIPLQMSLVNGIYSMLIFFVLSVIFKRFTIHGKAIPF